MKNKNKKSLLMNGTDYQLERRAQSIRDLLYAHVPDEVIAEVLGISLEQLNEDKVKLSKLYSERILEKQDPQKLYSKMISEYARGFIDKAEGKYNPLYKAACIVLDTTSLSRQFNLIQKTWTAIFTQVADILPIKVLVSEKDFYRDNQYFEKKFWMAVALGIVDISKVQDENELIDIALKFFSTKQQPTKFQEMVQKAWES